MMTRPKNRFLLSGLTVVLGLALAGRLAAQAPIFTPLYNFADQMDGAYPYAGLILSNGVLYGTTTGDGFSTYGSVFAMGTNGGAVTTLYDFTDGDDGAAPYAGLVLSGGTLYGATAYGGSMNYGTLFSVNTDGSGFTTIYTFTGNGDGGYPYGELAVSTNNVLFGTASYGGNSEDGTVFSVNTDGSAFTTLYSFSGNDGAYPYAGLILSGSTLYGTTYEGGNSGAGTVFKIDVSGTPFQTLYGFSGGDGSFPYAPLVLSGANLYGTTEQGGNSGYGGVFKVSTSGTAFTNLYSFNNAGDGSYPDGGLVLAGGTLYGTATAGGSSGNGTIFGVGTNGTAFSSLYSFTGNADGADPEAGLLLSGTTFYGTAAGGGASEDGTVFGYTLGASLVLQLNYSVKSGSVTDITLLAGNETDPSVTVNPNNPTNVFVVAISSATNGLITTYSTNLTKPWSAVSNIASTASTTLVPAYGEPSAAWDSNSNLFLAYEPATLQGIAVAVSTNGGKSFFALTNLATNDVTDQPRITAQATSTNIGSVWLVYKDYSLPGSPLVAQGLQTTNIGSNGIGAFSSAYTIPGSLGSTNGGFPDIAIGPNNQVMVAYQNNINSSSTSHVFVNVNSNTLTTNGFGPAITVTSDAIGGLTYIPVEPVANGINAGVGVAWDNDPTSQYFGRAYVVYTSAAIGKPAATSVDLRYSMNNGAAWSSEIKVNDDTDNYSHFLPRIAVDQATGSVALCWYDCRNDTGDLSTDNPSITVPSSSATNSYTNVFDLDGKANDDFMVYGTASLTGGSNFAPDIPMIPIWTKAMLMASNPPAGSFTYVSEAGLAGNANGLGHHIGLAYSSGNGYPVWADNSDFLQNNPAPTTDFQLYTANTILETANLGITVSNYPAVPTSDEIIAYYVIVTNYGPFAAPSVTISDTLPGSMTLVGQPSPALGGTYIVNGQTIIFSFPNLAAGASITNLIRVTAVQSGNAINAATVYSLLPDPVPGNNTFTSTLLINSEDLGVASVAASPGSVEVGSNVTFYVKVTNFGPAANGLIFLTNTLSPELTNITDVDPAGGAYSINGNTIVFSLNPLPVSSNVTVSFSATALSLGANYQDATNTIVVTSTDFDTNLANNMTNLIVPILGEDLGVGLSASTNSASIGDIITYTLNVTNFGPSSAGDITITNTVTDNLALQFSSAGTISGNVLTDDIGELPAGQTYQIIYTAQALSPSGPSDTNAYSTAFVSSSDFDTNLVNNLASTLVTINGEDLALGMTVSPPNPALGSTITYNLAVTNLGPSTTGSVTVADALSTNLTDISDVIQSPLIFYVYNNTIFFELGTMAVGQSTNLTFSAVVTAGGATATNAISSASISSTDFDQNLSNNTASAINPISGEDVTLRLTGSPGTVEFGQPITYTVIMTNLGPSTNGSAIATCMLSTNLDNITVVQCPGIYYISGQVIQFNDGSLKINQKATNIFTATPTSIGTATNTTVVESFLVKPAQVVTTTILPAPPITNLIAIPYASSAFIVWGTPVPSTVQVAYGLTTNYGSVTSLSGPSTNHIVMLTGLGRNTTYYFKILSWENGTLYSATGSFATVDTLILNTQDAAYTGSWLEGPSVLPGIYGSYFNVANTASSSNASATYAPTITTPGLYNVSVWYPQATNFSTNAQMAVTGTNLAYTRSINQTTNGGSWQALAYSLYYPAGTGGRVVIYNNTGETNREVAANAMMWSYVDSQDYPPPGTVPAWWAGIYFGGNMAAANANYAAYVFGTMPGSNPATNPQLWVNFASSNSVTVSFAPYQGGRIYQLQSATNIVNPKWLTLTNQPGIATNAVTNSLGVFPNGTGYGVFTTTVSNASQTYFRLSAQLGTNY